MNKDFYFDGRQIKNYLIGFASVFSEIPYRNRKGVLVSVPIHYGSPSDIISFLESDVDNSVTTNRNRLKDITIPLFSFRLSAIERNAEKKRAPLDTITVDLRHLGYGTGYVAMRPAPVKFTMELILWASSDYQAFEIVEQIVPYFNSPQQVTIEPLPRCPVSTTEIYMDSIEIDTEPESQKYSAQVTMSFTVSGWLLSQPRIWSTNMAFELSMLDKDYMGVKGVDLTDKYSVGHEIIDTNLIKPKTKVDSELSTLETFIYNTKLVNIYGDKLFWYNALIEAGRISSNGQIINNTTLVINYKGEEKILTVESMEYLIDVLEEIKFLYTNEVLKNGLTKHTLTDNIKILEAMFTDTTDTVDVYLKLLNENLVTRGFNLTNITISNSDKLNLFGTPRVDIDGTISRMKTYLAALENIKLEENIIRSLVSLDSMDGSENIFTTKFFELDVFVISVLLHNKFKDLDITTISSDGLFKIYSTKYKSDNDGINTRYNSLFLLYTLMTSNKNIGMKIDETNIGDVVQILTYDNNGNPIYDINNDGYINSTDLDLLGSVVDDISVFDFEIKYGIWHKKFDIRLVSDERILKIEESLKVLFLMMEKLDFAEFNVYINLYKNDLVTNTYNIPDDENIISEIKSLGYDITVIEEKLTMLGSFFNAINIVFNSEKRYITDESIMQLTEETKEILLGTDVNIPLISLSIFIEKYLSTITDINKKDVIEKDIRNIFDTEEYGVYLNNMKIFNTVYNDLKTQDYFINSLKVPVSCIDDKFPDIIYKINNLI